jgi:hypothetical protein
LKEIAKIILIISLFQIVDAAIYFYHQNESVHIYLQKYQLRLRPFYATYFQWLTFFYVVFLGFVFAVLIQKKEAENKLIALFAIAIVLFNLKVWFY